MHMSMRSDRALPEAAGLAGATDGAPTKSAISWGADAPLRYTLLALLAAGLGEMLLLRLFSRVGFHIPKGPEAALAFQGVADVGSFAFNLATVLAPLALILVLLPSLRGRQPLPRILLCYLLLGLLLPWIDGAGVLRPVYGLLTVGLLLLIALPVVISPGQGPAPRIALGVIVAAYLCSQYYVLAYDLYRLMGWQGPPAATTDVLAAGEALVVVAGVAV